MKQNWRIIEKIIYQNKLLQSTDHFKRRKDYRIKERIKTENCS